VGAEDRLHQAAVLVVLRPVSVGKAMHFQGDLPDPADAASDFIGFVGSSIVISLLATRQGVL
jgi:hypothetical protein